MSKTTARRTGTQRTIALPPAGEFLETLNQATESCTALCAVKGPTAKIIPANIRTQMRTLTRLNEYWAKNRSAYTALIEAAEQITATGGRTQRAAGSGS